MWVVVEYLIYVQIDNVVDIFLLKNTLVPYYINIISLCHHFICDQVKDGTVKISFVCSEEMFCKYVYQEPR